jgi:3-oxoacyl-[acyl-carrier-protein] synthase III
VALFRHRNISIAGLAATLPNKVVGNENLFDQETLKKFKKNVGIEFRRESTFNQSTSSFLDHCGQILIKELGWDKEEIEALVVVTQTPDYWIPGCATLIQKNMGLSSNCLVFDILHGCAGYIYGLAILGGLMSSGQIKKGMLLAGDTLTKFIPNEDISLSSIFSDAGSATALEFKENSPGLLFNLGSDGGGYRSVFMNRGGSKNPMIRDHSDLSNIQTMCLSMNGLDVLGFALREVAPNILQLLGALDKKENADFYIFHQANKILNDSLARKLNLPLEKVPSTLKEFGNTSSASIPITMLKTLEGEKDRGIRMVLSGFGSGFSWGSAYLDLKAGLPLKFDEI